MKYWAADALVKSLRMRHETQGGVRRCKHVLAFCSPEELVTVADRLVVNRAVLVTLPVRVLHRGDRCGVGDMVQTKRSRTLSHLEEVARVCGVVHDLALSLEPLECQFHVVAAAEQG